MACIQAGDAGDTRGADDVSFADSDEFVTLFQLVRLHVLYLC